MKRESCSRFMKKKFKRIKTYKDYIVERRNLIGKGYVLKEQMSKEAFSEYYSLLRKARRENGLKSQPWQTLISKEKITSFKQAKRLAKIESERIKQKVTYKQILRRTKNELSETYDYFKKQQKLGGYQKFSP